MAFKAKQLTLTPELTRGVIPANPIGYLFKAKSNTIKATQQTEENQFLGEDGEASEKSYGVVDIAGDMEFVLGTDNSPIVCTHNIGTASIVNTDNTATVAWALSTAYAVDDVVKHSDGKHIMVVYAIEGTGTSGATIPSLALYPNQQDGYGVKVIDNAGVNQITWIVLPLREAWVGSTASPVAQVVGNKVNHSDGLHTLTAYSVTGTALVHATVEPDLSAYPTLESGRGVRITDNEVVWTIMPLMNDYFGGRSSCLKTLSVEALMAEGCDGVNPTYFRNQGLYINQFPLTMNGDNKSVSASLSLIGTSQDNSISNDAFVALSDTAGFTEVQVRNDIFDFERVDFYVDDVLATATTSMNLTVNRNITMTNGLNSEKIEGMGNINITGSIELLFSQDTYLEAFNHSTKSLRIVMTKANGSALYLYFPQYKMDRVDPDMTIDKDVMLSVPINAHGDDTSKSVYWGASSPIQNYGN